MTDRQACGTYPGLKLHIDLGEPLDPACATLATNRTLTNERRQPTPHPEPQQLRDLKALIAVLAHAMTGKP